MRREGTFVISSKVGGLFVMFSTGGSCKRSYCFVEPLGTNTAVTISFLVFMLVASLIINFSVRKVESDANVAKEGETIIDIDDSSYLLKHTQNENQQSETVNHLDRSPGNLTAAEAEETGSGTPRDGTEPAQSQSQSGTEVQDPELKTEFKIACLVLPISFGGIISVVASLHGNERAVLPHKVLFKAYAFSIYSSFISSAVIFILIAIRPKISCLATMVRIVMWVTLGLLTYAIALAMCVLLPMNLMGRILVLVSPAVLVGLAIVFCFVNHFNNSPRFHFS